MALTYSANANLGDKLPTFTLPTVNGASVDSGSLRGPVLVMFICNHCPYVKAIEDRLLDLGREYRNRAAVLAICANDPSEHPEDAPPELRKRALEKDYPFPYLVDESQTVAKAFGAVCTPDFFLYDKNLCLSYRGRLDDSWRNPAHVRKRELKAALDAILSGAVPDAAQNSSMGCSIKWK